MVDRRWADLAAFRAIACREAFTGFLTSSSFSGVASKADVSTASRTTSSRAFCSRPPQLSINHLL